MDIHLASEKMQKYGHISDKSKKTVLWTTTNSSAHKLCFSKHQKDRAVEDKKSKDLTPTSRGVEPEEGGRHRDNKGDKPGKAEKAKKGEKKDKDRSKDKEKGKRGHGGHEDEENAASTSSSHRRSLEPPPMDDRG